MKPTSPRKRWWGLVLLAVVSLLVPSFAPAAIADNIGVGDSVWVGARQGYSGTGIFPIYKPAPADPANPGEPDLWAYCIEHDVHAKTKLSGVVGDASGYLGANHFTEPAVQAKVLWVIAHAYPALSLSDLGTAAGAPSISRNDAIEATQYAIWRYTDLTWDAAWNWSSPNSEAAYWYLVNGANANAGETPADTQVTVSVDGPTGSQTVGSLVGPFTVHTNQVKAAISSDPAVAIVDANGNAIDTNAVVDGQKLYLDLRNATAAGSATVTAAVSGSSSSGKIVSVPNTAGGTATAGDHAQSIVLVAADNQKTTATATTSWTAPEISTTLVDASDQDHNLVYSGGVVTDTIAYQNLTPGQQYLVSGELMKKSDGSATGITGSKLFVPVTANGTVEVQFTIPAGYGGESLVAFEKLQPLAPGSTVPGPAVATHEDIDDAAQTVAVGAVPAISTTLVDTADGDHSVGWNGGSVADTIAYQNLTPGQQYTVSGELMKKSDGSATGITGVRTFTPTEANGTVDVLFAIPSGHAGETFVAFEKLFAGGAASGTPVAMHEDIEDAAQTVVVERAPNAAVPAIGTSLVDAADGDHTVAWGGGSVTDTVAYRNLVPGTEYTASGELMRKSDGSATGITGTRTFTPTEANGEIDVVFAIPNGHAGETFVAFEKLFAGGQATGAPVATHEDIEDAAQTVVLGKVPASPEPVIGTTLLDGSDGDHVLSWKGGDLVDTVAYRNLKPGTEYTVSGELMRKSDGSATGITGTRTFTPSAPNGSVEVKFTVPAGYDGETLVAFEKLYAGTEASGSPVAAHEDIEDAAQTVLVGKKPATPTTTAPGDDLATTGSSAPLLAIGALALLGILLGGAVLTLARRRTAAERME